MSHRRQVRGFTLIELMIVVAIIAILAAIAIPTYQNYLIRTQVSEGMSLVAGAETTVWDFVANTNRFPSGNLSAGLPSATSIKGHYVSQVVVTNGQITANYGGSQANSVINGDQLVLSPLTSGGSISWNCSSLTTVPGQYLPSSCRQ
jgi:type IV pilus assembly protein PilA